MKKNPVYFNAAVRLLGDGGNPFSCNCIVDEVVGEKVAGEKNNYSDANYDLPEVRAYKKMLGINHNGAISFPVSFFDDESDYRGDMFNFCKKRRNIRAFALLLAYESGVGT
jgi:hypothetical protein